MVDQLPKEVPPVKGKTVNRQEVMPGERPDTGGDAFDRSQRNYSKNPLVREEDPFAPYDAY